MASDKLSRRGFLTTAAGAGVAALAAQGEADVVDDRLTRKVALAAKGMALSDLCEHLRTETGVHLEAGRSVADEKVTVFCQKLPLREVMRQLSRPFGYTWVRSGAEKQYRYELMQDLRSQLLEEELRNRDRNEALLALEREIEKYRPYLSLSPDEVLARAKTASPAEKKLLENIGGGGPRSGLGWGVIQMYFRLSPPELAALREGEELKFSQEPKSPASGNPSRPLPPDVARGVLQSLRDWRLIKMEEGYGETDDLSDPRGLPLTAVPDARAVVTLKLNQTEMGQFGLGGLAGHQSPGTGHLDTRGPYAVGVSPRASQSENAVANAKLAGDPALRRRVSLQPERDPARAGKRSGGEEGKRGGEMRNPSPGPSSTRRGENSNSAPEPKVTTAEVLEALHRATGMPIVADYYTRLYQPEEVSAKDQPLFEALNRLADTMRLRWRKEGDWLQFRSASYYHDRLKEVPNRLLHRWVTARREHGMLTLDDLVEIAGLPDAPLRAAGMAEGAKEYWGLVEWDLARNHMVLPNLRYLAQFTPAQRQEAASAAGLPFTKMSLAQQQGFLARAFPGEGEGLQSLEELAGAALRVDYTQPDWYEWQPPARFWLRWIVPLAPGPNGRRAFRPAVRERTKEAALQALRRVDPEIRAAVRAAVSRSDPRLAQDPPAEEAQIAPTELQLVTIYLPDTANKHSAVLMKTDLHSQTSTW